MSQHEQLELIWQEVLNIMASELAKPSFDAWIKDSRPVHFEGNVLFVELPNEFTRDWVDAIRRPLAENAPSCGQQGVGPEAG